MHPHDLGLTLLWAAGVLAIVWGLEWHDRRQPTWEPTWPEAWARYRDDGGTDHDRWT
jgi:hypothetical protein